MAAGVKNRKSRSREVRRESAKRQRATIPEGLRSTFGFGLLGAGLLWLSLPPVDWGVLGWIAPLPWLLLVRRQQLGGKRPYGQLYLVGVVFSATVFYWLTLPHWSAILGWVAMFLYLGWYLVLFVGLSRVAVHTLRVPLILAAPVVWTGLELVRAYFATGFLLAALGHTQYRWITLIQISDLVGAYGVSFLVMFVAGGAASMLPFDGQPRRLWPALPAAVAVAGALLYGHFRTTGVTFRDGPTTALIQGSIDTEFNADVLAVQERMYKQYMQLSFEALREQPDIDLLIWPESMYIVPLMQFDQGAYLPADQLVRIAGIEPSKAAQWEARRRMPDVFQKAADAASMQFKQTSREMASVVAARRQSAGIDLRGGPALMLGVDGQRYTPGKVLRYNTSVHLDGSGDVVDYYHKMHPVMFGEYVPLGDWFPSLYNLTPLDGGLTAGLTAKTFKIAGTGYAPNICYETILPHVIRGQVVQLQGRGEDPDVLVTQTNDGWFWGSAALDMHLICGVFRTVECRKPLLIAANTGLSASVDGNGRILTQGPRRATRYLIVQPKLDPRHSFYIRGGDWFAMLCAACCVGLAIVGVVNRRRVAAERRQA